MCLFDFLLSEAAQFLELAHSTACLGRLWLLDLLSWHLIFLLRFLLLIIIIIIVLVRILLSTIFAFRLLQLFVVSGIPLIIEASITCSVLFLQINWLRDLREPLRMVGEENLLWCLTKLCDLHFESSSLDGVTQFF